MGTSGLVLGVAWAAGVVWLALCLAAQARRHRRWTVEWLLPHWHLFAPEPGAADHLLGVRTRTAPDGTTSETVFDPPPRRAWEPIFDPAGRRERLVRDLLQELADHAGADPDLSAGVRRSLAREARQRLAVAPAPPPAPTELQLLLVARRDRSDRVLLETGWLPFPEAPGAP